MKQKYSELRVQKWKEFCGKNNMTEEDGEEFRQDDEIENDLDIDFHLNYMKEY